MVLCACVAALKKLRQEECLEFMVSNLGYIVNCRPAWARVRRRREEGVRESSSELERKALEKLVFLSPTSPQSCPYGSQC